jgi:flagellar hook-basal body complex protein FliE
MNNARTVEAWMPPSDIYDEEIVGTGHNGKWVSSALAPDPSNLHGLETLLNSLQLYRQGEILPNDRFLDQPRASPYGDMGPNEAVFIKAIDNFFYDSVSVVLMIGDQINQTATVSLKVKKNEIEENMKAQLKEIKKKYAALRKKEKMGLLGKIFNWIAVAVTGVVCAAATVMTGGAALGIAATVFALTLAVTILDETGKMDDVIKGVADMLKTFGVNEKQAELIAGIAVAVTIAVVMIAATICMPTAGAGTIAQAGSAMRRAAQLTMRVSEAVNAGVTTVQGGTSITEGVYKKDEYLSKARLNEINARMKSFEEQIQQLLQNMEENHERTEETKKMLLDGAHDIAQEVVRLINNALGLGGGSAPSSA